MRRIGSSQLGALLIVIAFSLPLGAAHAEKMVDEADDAKKDSRGVGEPGSGEDSGGGDGAGGSNTAVCVTQGGPLHCTGRFSGTWDMACMTTGSAAGVKDYGVGSLSFLADGSVELRLKSTSAWGNTETLPGSESNPIRGKIDSNGHVLIERNQDDVSLRWEGQFSLAPAAGGNRAAGSGRYNSKGVFLGGDVVQTCQGSFKLD